MYLIYGVLSSLRQTVNHAIRLKKHSVLALVCGVCLPSVVLAQSLGTLPSSGDSTVPDSAASMLNEPRTAELPVVSGLEPFGASLFKGGFGHNSEDGLNPEYLLQPGDTVSVRIWGATSFNDSLRVDHQGNIFIPGVGPVMLGGVSNRRLNSHVANAVSRVYTDNVKVYTSLDGAQPVAVFVTGGVNSPGRFSGIPSNSVLYFLDQAGGIDARRGSYRTVTIRRQNTVLADVDLYDFLREGTLPTIQFKDGDTIIVAPKGASVAVTGDVRNEGLLELSDLSISGQQLIDIAMVEPGVSYVGTSGIRQGQTSADYLSIDEFRHRTLLDGDRVHFRVDQTDDLMVIDVEGAYKGPSRYVVSRNTRLYDVLDYIEIDQELANIAAISLKRKQIAQRQKAALNDSLRRLQSRYLTASSNTDAESAIRAREAELINQFVENAARVEPDGRLVLSQGQQIANVMLQSGDTIVIPEHRESVLLSGEVLIAQAVLHQAGLHARDYIERSGGFSNQADRSRIVVIRANGDVVSGGNPVIERGDEVIVLPKVPVKNLQLAATIVDIIYKVAVAASVAVNL